MAFVTSTNTDDVEAVAIQIDVMAVSMRSQLEAWRARIDATNQSASQETRANYQAMTSLRTYAEAKKGTPGLAEVTRRRLNQPASYDPGAEWNALKPKMDDLISWLATNWPEKTTSGKLAYDGLNAATGELEAFNISLTAGQKNGLLTRIDAVIAGIV